MNGLIEIPYEPPCSVWEILSSILPSSEHDIVRKVLGPSLVEQANDLHEEVKCLLEIWEYITYQTPKKNLLLDQSAVKDRLIKEVSLLLDVLRDRASQEGKSLEDFLQKHNSKVLDFCSSPATSRPSSSRRSTASSSGRQTPVIAMDSERLSKVEGYNSQVEIKLKALQPKMKYLEMREITTVLRQMLGREISQLKEDITFLQKCLEDPNDEPSLGELKEERNKLESRILLTGEDKQFNSTSSGLPKKSGKIQLEPLPVRTSPVSSANEKSRRKEVFKSGNSGSSKIPQVSTSQPLKLSKADKLRAIVDSSKS